MKPLAAGLALAGLAYLAYRVPVLGLVLAALLIGAAAAAYEVWRAEREDPGLEEALRPVRERVMAPRRVVPSGWARAVAGSAGKLFEDFSIARTRKDELISSAHVATSTATGKEHRMVRA